MLERLQVINIVCPEGTIFEGICTREMIKAVIGALNQSSINGEQGDRGTVIFQPLLNMDEHVIDPFERSMEMEIIFSRS